MSTEHEVKDLEDMLGWGMITALDRNLLNQFLMQEYIRRFNTSDFLPPVSGILPVTSSQRYVIESFLMDRPRMFFESTDLNDSKANMMMRVLGGNQINQEYKGNQWHAQSIEYFSPSHGPVLRFNLLLGDTPVAVDDDGALYIDLQKSSDFVLELSEIEFEQKIGGDFFKALFAKLKPEQRRYRFGNVNEHIDPLLQPRFVRLRTQKKKADKKDLEGAVVLFTHLGGGGDQPPTAPDTLEYLLRPDETARVLFNGYSVAVPLAMGPIVQAFGGRAAEVIYDKKRLVGFRFTAPDLSAVGGVDDFTGYVPKGNAWDQTYCRWSVGAISVPTGRVINYRFRNGFYLSGGFDIVQGIPVEFKEFGNPFKEWVGARLPGFEEIVKSQGPKSFALNHDVDAQYGPRSGRPTITVSAKSTKALLSGKGQDEGELAVDAPRNQQYEDPEQFVSDALEWVNADRQFRGLLSTVTGKYRDRLHSILDVEGTTQDLAQLVKLNFGEMIKVNDIKYSQNADVSGVIAPHLTAFRIAPLEVVVHAGTTHPFNVDPHSPDIEWTLDDPSRSDKLGSITPAGLYTAPAASTIEGLFRQVRVTATDKKTGFKASALVAVLKSALRVNPLITVTPSVPIDPVQLKAGSLGGAGEQLTWSIKQTGTQGSISPTIGTTISYMPREDFDDEHYDAFVVDEVTVTNGKDSETCYIINIKYPPHNTVKYEHKSETTVQCTAMKKGQAKIAEWKILHGPGSIDVSTGLYTADPSAPERFVLIHSMIEPEDDRDDGYLILPLPLSEEARALPGTVQVSPTGQMLREIRPMN